jgi:hypothetical protein
MDSLVVSGSWLLQDGAYSYSDFVEPFEEYEVQARKYF